MKKILVVNLLCIVLAIQSVLACTAITIIGNDGHSVAGRTMEWGFDWDWNVKYVPTGTKHILTAPKDLNLPTKEYISKYSVIGEGLDVNNTFVFLDGQNSQGLALSANYLPGFTQYQTVSKDDKNYASILEIVQFVLSQSSNLVEAKQLLENYKVWNNTSTEIEGVEPELHFLISDRSGNAIVVEYIKGEVKFYNLSLDVKVMTNAPTYDWHLINIRNYLGLSNETISNIKLYNENNVLPTNKKFHTIDALGQGNGLFGMPGDYSPPSRFIRTAALGYYSNNTGVENENSVNKVAHILHNADIPKGVVAEKVADEVHYDHTAFTAIKDLNDNILYINIYDNPLNSVAINLNELDKKQTKEFTKSIKKLPYPKADITSQLS